MNVKFMKTALEIAKTSGIDIPVGAVVVKDNKVIALSANEREKSRNTINHAEMLAIQKANLKLNNYRLTGCEIYVTLEPCPMCASAIVQAKFKSVYFGAYDMLYGAFGSKIDMGIFMNYPIYIKGGILETECTQLLKDYFKGIRNDSCS